MPPPTRRRKRDPAAAFPAIDPADRVSKLPDEILTQILSFLPAREAVRTCVLARAWRDVWKLTTRLLITGDSVQEVRGFVAPLLRRRLDYRLQCAPLDACEIAFDPAEDEDGDAITLNDEDTSTVNGWIRRALRCRVASLRVDMGDRLDLETYLQMSKRLISPHLTRLELRGVWFICRHLDFSGCPALEHLEITYCNFADVRKMASPSLKRLVIESCESIEAPYRFQICVPRLVSLRMEDVDFRAPLLECMPELVEAYVKTGSYLDSCSCNDPMGCIHVTRDGDVTSDSEAEEGADDFAGQTTKKCVLLEGLAQAKDLVLIAGYHLTYIFRRDLRWCPTFSKLKTLVINDDLCAPADCSVLAGILKHAPFLEKLTIVFSDQVRCKYKVEVKGHFDAKVKSTMISQHLKIVEVKCEMVNERFLSILNFLGTLDICLQIKVTKK